LNLASEYRAVRPEFNSEDQAVAKVSLSLRDFTGRKDALNIGERVEQLPCRAERIESQIISPRLFV
jgi:hypothetical protein